MTLLRLLAATAAVFISPSAEAAGTDLNCPSDGLITESELTPQGIRTYFEKNSGKLKSPGDFLCCLPQAIRSNYIIGHDSFAGQNGSMDNPRVILFPPLRKAGQAGMNNKPMKAAFSINSFGSGMRQSESVEFMFNNEESGKLEYYDLTLDPKSGRPHMTDPNPQLCMSCHGADKHAERFGPRPLFAPSFSWDGFIKGRDSCGEALEQAIESKVRNSIYKNPSYRCLNPLVDGVSPFQSNGVRPSFILDEFDRTMDNFNQRRIAKVIMSTPEFDKYQFAIAGVNVCPSSSELSFDNPNAPFNKSIASVDRLREWLPASEIEKLKSQAALLPEIRDQKFEDALSFAKRRLSNVPKAPTSIDEPPTDIVDKCRAQNNQTALGIVDGIGRPKDVLDEIYKRYEIDSAVRSVRGRMINSDFRMLTEARGIDIGWWGMQIWASYSRNPDDHLLTNMIEADPNGKLAAALKPLKKFLPSRSQLSFRNSPPKERAEILKIRSAVCSVLKKESLAAFASVPLPSRNAGDAKRPVTR